MIRNTILLFWVLFLSLSSIGIAQKKETKQPKEIVYKIPEGLDDNVKAEYIKFLDFGHKLYSLHCAKCHGESGEGAKGVPNFTEKELESYRARSAIAEGINKMPSFKEKISEPDLQKILMFLEQFKK
jgi:mono/diheme cytochrome c family protein